MAIITLRQSSVVSDPSATIKGSPLTNSEVDNNFANINIELADLGAANLSTFSATTSEELAGVISDETGTGNLVFNTSPVLVTPNVGVASGISYNKVTITEPATGSTLTIADGKTVAVDNSLTFTGTDSSSVNFGAGGTVVFSGDYAALANVTVGDGTVSIPAVNFTSDPNTGLYRSGTDVLEIVTGGAIRANADAVGYFMTTFADKVVDLGTTSGTVTINCRLGNLFYITIDGTTTFQPTNAKTNGGTSFTLIVTNSGAGHGVATTGGTFKYPYGGLTRTSTDGATDVYFFFSPDGGTTWYVTIPMKDLSTGTIS